MQTNRSSSNFPNLFWWGIILLASIIIPGFGQLFGALAALFFFVLALRETLKSFK